MADELAPTEPTAPVPTEIAAPSAPPAAEQPMTAEAIRALVAAAERKAYDAGAAAARKAVESKQPKPATPATPPPSHAPVAAPAADDLDFADELNDAISAHAFTLDQRKEVRNAARRDRSKSPGEVVEHWARLFGVSPAGANNATQPAAGPNMTPTTPARPSPSVPTAPAPAAAAPDIVRQPLLRAMDSDAARSAADAYVRSKGGDPANPYDVKTMAAHREMRLQFEQAMRDTAVLTRARR